VTKKLTKEELREQTLQRLKNFTGTKRIQAEQDLKTKLTASFEWQKAQCVALTISLPFEISTDDLIKQAWKEQKKVVVPTIKAGSQMDFFQINPQTYYQNSKFGIKEPIDAKFIAKEEIDFILVPGIVYNKNGYRIGFGKGFYDRYLSNFHKNTASLAFFWQINNTWIPKTFDQKVQKLYLEKSK
jgi:5-formyltetrahydrofolate cyclo-ligase